MAELTVVPSPVPPVAPSPMDPIDPHPRAEEVQRLKYVLGYERRIKRVNCKEAAAVFKTGACTVNARYMHPWPEVGHPEGQVLYYGQCSCGRYTRYYRTEYDAWYAIFAHVYETIEAEKFVERVLA